MDRRQAGRHAVRPGPRRRRERIAREIRCRGGLLGQELRVRSSPSGKKARHPDRDSASAYGRPALSARPCCAPRGRGWGTRRGARPSPRGRLLPRQAASAAKASRGLLVLVYGSSLDPQALNRSVRGAWKEMALCSAGGTKTSQGVLSPWLRLNRWRLGSRSRSDAVYDTALAILYFHVFPGDHDVSSAEFAPQDEHVTASVRPPLAAQASHPAEFSIILCCRRGRRGRVFRAYRRHLSIVPPGSSEVVCSTFAAETHTATRLLGAQAGERAGSRGRQGCALVGKALVGGGSGLCDAVEADAQPGGDERKIGQRHERVARHVIAERGQQDEG